MPDKPIRQDALAAELGVSKIPLREALTRLEQEGLLNSQANRGYFVQPMSAKQVDEIYDAAARHRARSRRGLCRRARDRSRSGRRDRGVRKLDGAAKSNRRGRGANRDFHTALVRPGGRLLTTQLVERLSILAERYVVAHLSPRGANRGRIPSIRIARRVACARRRKAARTAPRAHARARSTIFDSNSVRRPSRGSNSGGSCMFGPRKSLDSVTKHAEGHALAKTLSWPHLIALGVGAIVGTGIYTLTGVGAERAGPAVILAFAIAGAVCACAALAYAELATMIPAAGSAYTFSYSPCWRESLAWIVGWSLILEYSLACSTVAVGWSGYLVGWIQPPACIAARSLLAGRMAGASSTCRPCSSRSRRDGHADRRHARERDAQHRPRHHQARRARRVRRVALPAFDGTTSSPSCPMAFSSTEVGGEKRGVMAAAAIVFFAFYGFDAVATSAEEAKNPGRDLTIGIVGSMAGVHDHLYAVCGRGGRRVALSSSSPIHPSRWRWCCARSAIRSAAYLIALAA
jgi:DNA-binding GntR family transcriptional regulator